MFGALSAIVREEGVQGLFRSLPVSIVLCSNPAIQFFAYERIRRGIVGTSSRSLSAVEGFAAGALAKAIATVLTFPLQVVQTRMQAGVDNDDGGENEESADSHPRDDHEEDEESADSHPAATPAAAPRTPAAMASSRGEDDAKAAPLPSRGLSRAAAAAAAAGGGGGGGGNGSAVRQRSSSVLAALTSLLRQGGVAALFKGMGPKLLQTVLNAALMFALYERFLNSSKAVVRSIVGKTGSKMPVV